MPWRGPTAPPPQMPRIDPAALTMMREHVINVHALAELTGVPTLYRWGRAIWERRPIHEIEHEYFERVYRHLQQLGAAVPQPPRLEVPQRGIIPADYVAEGARKPPPTVPDRVSAIIAPDLPEDLKRRLHAVGVPTSPEDVAGQVAGRSLVLALTAVPGFTGMTKEAAKQLVGITAAGFGVPGAGAAATRTVQGFPEEAPRAFFEVGLASTVVGDIASIMRALPGMVRGGKVSVDEALNNVKSNMPPTLRDSPEVVQFMRELDDALARLKRGDTSKYDELLRQLDDWQKKLQEFEYLSVLKKAEALPPGQERRFYELMNEVDKIKDKYDVLKAFIDEVRSAGTEERGRWVADYIRFTGWRATTSDLAAAAAEMPPGLARDLFNLLADKDLASLQRILYDHKARANLARRLGVDEETLLEHASMIYKMKREMDALPDLARAAAEMPPGLARDVAMRHAAPGRSPEPPKLPEVQPPQPVETPKLDVKPPVERRFMHQRREPETGGMEVVTKDGQILIVKNKEEVEVKPKVGSLAKPEDFAIKDVVEPRSGVWVRARPDAEGGVQMPKPFVGLRRRVRDVDADGTRSTHIQDRDATVKADDATTGRTDQPTVNRTDQPVVGRTSDADSAVKDEAVVVTGRDLLRFMPYLPPTLLSMPVVVALPATARVISQVLGAPVSLRLPPPPNPSMPLGTYLKMLRFPVLGRQREVFVLI